MRGQRGKRPTCIVGIENSPTERIAVQIRVRTEIQDGIDKNNARRRRGIGGVVVEMTVLHGVGRGVQQQIGRRVVAAELHRGIGQTHPPRKSIVAPFFQQIDFLLIVPVSGILGPE